MAELDSESLTLSVVDDGFFVLLKAFGRSVRSGAATLAVIPLLNSIVDAIRTQMMPVLHQYMRKAGPASVANDKFFIGVNSMQARASHSPERFVASSHHGHD